MGLYQVIDYVVCTSQGKALLNLNLKILHGFLETQGPQTLHRDTRGVKQTLLIQDCSPMSVNLQSLFKIVLFPADAGHGLFRRGRLADAADHNEEGQP